MDGGEGGTEE
jgi:hypothetical protein